MMASITFFSALVYTAIAMTMVTPIVLIILFIRDVRKGEIW